MIFVKILLGYAGNKYAFPNHVDSMNIVDLDALKRAASNGLYLKFLNNYDDMDADEKLLFNELKPLVDDESNIDVSDLYDAIFFSEGKVKTDKIILIPLSISNYLNPSYCFCAIWDNDWPKIKKIFDEDNLFLYIN